MSSPAPRGDAVDGAIVIDKPVGPTSHDVVVCARRTLGVRRIGHTGTLDPLASGVLPLVVGQATRLARHLTGTDKEYVATIRFGVISDTHDAVGHIVERGSRMPASEDLARALAQFIGVFDQVPPLYSAKIVGGERSYVRARAGTPVQPPPARVRVDRLELLDIAPPCARVLVRCSAGFYVRSLARDIGEVLGTGAILDALVRTEAAGFTSADAVPFDVLVTAARGELRARVRPLRDLLTDIPLVVLTPEGEAWARHGRDLGPPQIQGPLGRPPELVRLMGPEGRMIGLAEPSRTPGFLHPSVIFSYN
jgi:tRNA pseudouridine55 synthase